MHRFGRRSLRRRTAIGAFVAALALTVSVPSLASANPVDDLLGQLGLGNAAGGGSGGGAEPKLIEPPPYTPPLHGSNPHGQGTATSLTLKPPSDLPYSSDPGENDEIVVLGSSRGEQDSGSGAYHGSVTLAHVFGFPVVQVQSDPGDPPQSGPLGPLQDGLDDICDDSSGLVCLTVLGMHSSTTGNSSTNSFRGLDVGLGGDDGLGLALLRSDGNIAQDNTCQNSHGSSSVGELSLGRELSLGLFDSVSDSQDCNNGTSSVNQSSSAVVLGDDSLPSDCADGEEASFFLFIAQVICNANDENGTQTSSPYGVREALTTLIFPFFPEDDIEFLQTDGESIALLKATTAAAESHAVAPPVTTTPTSPSTPPAGGTQGGTGGGTQGGDDGGDDRAGDGPAAEEATVGAGRLAFTGSDLLWLALIGDLLILGGIALTSAARRRDRAAA
jgi:hypothetical protein